MLKFACYPETVAKKFYLAGAGSACLQLYCAAWLHTNNRGLLGTRSEQCWSWNRSNHTAALAGSGKQKLDERRLCVWGGGEREEVEG